MSCLHCFIPFDVGDLEFSTDVGSYGYLVNGHPHHRFTFVEHGYLPTRIIIECDKFAHVLDLRDAVFPCVKVHGNSPPMVGLHKLIIYLSLSLLSSRSLRRVLIGWPVLVSIAWFSFMYSYLFPVRTSLNPESPVETPPEQPYTWPTSFRQQVIPLLIWISSSHMQSGTEQQVTIPTNTFSSLTLLC